MPVFISHRTADDAIAAGVYDRLTNYHRIKCYIDNIDRQVSAARGTATITSLIVKRLNECTNLLAIVTENTQGSWWVPFEVGVARQAPRVITSFTNQWDRQMPEYLLEWPRLRGQDAIDTYAKYYKQQSAILNRTLIEKRATATEQITTADQFHRHLKAALGQ